MPTRSGKDYQPPSLRMTGFSQPKTGASQPNITLEQLAKSMQDMMVQTTAKRQEQNAQTEELKPHLEEIEQSYQNDNGRRHERDESNELEIETDVEFEMVDDCRICGQGQNLDGWVMKSVKIDAPTFDGWIDLHVFSHWLSNMGHYFKWHKMSEVRKV